MIDLKNKRGSVIKFNCTPLRSFFLSDNLGNESIEQGITRVQGLGETQSIINEPRKTSMDNVTSAIHRPVGYLYDAPIYQQ